jgi:hypothetical protein
MMSRAEIYERNAAECERECARATTLVLKRKYRDLAQQWRDMAEQADRAVVNRTQRPERKKVGQFYAKAEDEERCLQSSITRQSVMVQGLTTEGKLLPFSGTVRRLRRVRSNTPTIRFGSR